MSTTFTAASEVIRSDKGAKSRLISCCSAVYDRHLCAVLRRAFNLDMRDNNISTSVSCGLISRPASSAFLTVNALRVMAPPAVDAQRCPSSDGHCGTPSRTGATYPRSSERRGVSGAVIRPSRRPWYRPGRKNQPADME